MNLMLFFARLLNGGFKVCTADPIVVAAGGIFIKTQSGDSVEARKLDLEERQPDASSSVKIFAVQLQGDLTQELEKFGDGVKVCSFTFLDRDKIANRLGEANVVVIGWDGEYGMAKKFLPFLKGHANKAEVPIFLVRPVALTADNPDMRKLGIARSFVWPKDSHKLNMHIYDICHADNEDDKSDEGLGFDANDLNLLQGDQIEKLSQVKEPPRPSEYHIIQACQAEITKRDKLKEDLLKLREDNPHFYLGRVLVYHEDVAGAAGLCRHLKSGGIVNSFHETKISDAINRLSDENVRSVLAWYGGTESEKTAELVREINESRSLQQVSIVLVTPGETATQKLAKKAKELVYDQIVSFEKQPSQFAKQFIAAMKVGENPASVSHALCVLRSKWRPSLPSQKRRPLKDEEISERVESLAGHLGKRYWSESEHVLHLSLAKKKEEANKAADQLLKDFPKRLDAVVVAASARLLRDGADKTGDWLVNKALGHRELNLEKCYAIGQLLASWRAVKPFEAFLIEWHNRDDLSKGHQFFYLMACYQDLINEPDKMLRFLGVALKDSPLRTEYILKMLDYTTRRKDRKRSVEFLKILAYCPGLNQTLVQLTLANAYIQLGSKSFAREVINGLLAKQPNMKQALALKAKL